jgi:putative acetyltransferase
MPATITLERPDTPDAVLLIDELEAELADFYPDESRHGLSVEQLIELSVSFFVVREDGVPAACGGVQFFDGEYGEVKRMYVRPQFRGLGLAKLVLERTAEHTRENGISILRLETGIHQTDAIALYEKWGFRRIGPFGEYEEDPLSVFYEKQIDGLPFKSMGHKI